MKIPIVMAAFGTTTTACQSYSSLDNHIRAAFPGHEIHWAFSSRMVRDFSRRRHGLQTKSPTEVLEALRARGFEWAVVQSLHLLAGHEFYRLVEEVQACLMRTAMGLPLLWAPADYRAFLENLAARLHTGGNGDAIVLVGHGTDHPSWAAYPALQYLISQQFGHQIYVGVLEGHPSRDEVVAEVVRSGLKRVRLLPLMLVAGRHLQTDLAGSDDSWKASCERAGLTVTLEATGLLHDPGVIKIFQDHIGKALEAIRGRNQSAALGTLFTESTYGDYNGLDEKLAEPVGRW
jgi:sirohydrochlorin cobaltochelatase